MSDKCKGLLGRMRCNFVPRYDNIGPSAAVMEAMAKIAATGLTADVDGEQRYVCDVCTACGEQVQRPWPAEPRGNE